MSDFITFLRTNPVVLAILVGSAIGTLVLSFISFLMLRAGLSIRPIVFVAVFMLIVGGPQVLYHLSQAMGWIPGRELVWFPARDRGGMYGFTEHDSVTAAVDGKFVHARQLFGGDADPALITDLRQIPNGPFVGAVAAQMAALPPSSSVIVARFADASAARAAGMRYIGQVTGAAAVPGSDGMWTVQRPVGDIVKAVAAGRTLLIATGPDEKSALARLNATGAFSANQTDPTISPAARDFWLYQPIALITIFVAMLLASCLWFFRGSSWAGTSRPAPETAVQSVAEVRRRLLAVNAVDAPLTIAEDERRRIVITWRFADAKWVDLARAHGLSRTHRIILELDESSHSVRPTEQQASLDWSAGVDGASVDWHSMAGIIFFQQEHVQVFGLQLDTNGRFTPALTYAYSFNLQEMKEPFVQAVLGAGWRWRPVIWQGPVWMRWLTG